MRLVTIDNGNTHPHVGLYEFGVLKAVIPLEKYVPEKGDFVLIASVGKPLSIKPSFDLKTKTLALIGLKKSGNELLFYSWNDSDKKYVVDSKQKKISGTLGTFEFHPTESKIVFSKTLTSTSWSNSKVFNEITSEKIIEWKSRDGKDAVIFGSGQIVRALTKLGLIDEYRLMVSPTILGSGMSLFEGAEKMSLKLISTRAFGNGNVLLCYEPL